MYNYAKKNVLISYYTMKSLGLLFKWNEWSNSSNAKRRPNKLPLLLLVYILWATQKYRLLPFSFAIKFYSKVLLNVWFTCWINLFVLYFR